MKKLLSLLLVLVLSLSLVACGGDGEGKGKEEDKAKTMETEATEVAEGFLDAFAEFDFEEAGKYLDDEDVLPDKEEVLEIDPDAVLSIIDNENIRSNLAPHTEKFRPAYELLQEKLVDTISYEIIEVEVDEDEEEVTFTVELTNATRESLGNIDDSEIRDMLTAESLTALENEWYESGKADDTTTQEEAFEMLAEEIAEKLEQIFEDAELETDTEERELVVVKDGDNWVIDTKKSDLD